MQLEVAAIVPANGFLWTCPASGHGSPSSPPAAAVAEEEVAVALQAEEAVAGVGLSVWIVAEQMGFLRWRRCWI